MQIHINRDGQNFGPYSLDEVRQYLASGNIVVTDLAWYEGAAGWMPLGQVPGVAPSARPVAAAAVAAPAAARAVAAASPASSVDADALLPAGFWKRAAAYLIDGLLLGILSSVLIGALTAGLIGSAASGSEQAIGAAFTAIALINVGTMVAMWLYFALMESSGSQATLGKMALGLIVTDADGARIGFARATGRFFGKLLSGLIFGIGFLMVGFTARKQGLHDMLASTLVVNRDPNARDLPTWLVVVLAIIVFGLPALGFIGALAIPMLAGLR